ncbi:splicing factor, Prp19-binding domain-containing protein [Geopyxis carbonaria]|nr:splicing factor, Prp19-binding domain-containing protein [Geopyxis carbonaria]
MPPKRMTANPVRPARYRPGKQIAPEETDSNSDSENSEQSEASTKPSRPVYTKSRRGEPPSIISKTLQNVNLHERFEQSRENEEVQIAVSTAQESQADNSSDEYTTESSSESSLEEEELTSTRKTLLRPTFVPKCRRHKSGQQNSMTSHKTKIDEEERKKKETEELLEEHLKRDAAAKVAGRKNKDDDNEEEAAVDDTDGLNPAAERTTWKLRELLRVKREREALEAIEMEREEIGRRREMDPELRNKEDLEYVQEQRKQKLDSRGKMGFMQKFYHKGAFYQDESEVLKRDYATAAVDDSAKNREVLPKYMQVRGDEVGKRGRTRWTHLSAEDTSIQDAGSPWNQSHKRIRRTELNAQDQRYKEEKFQESHQRYRDQVPSGQDYGQDFQPDEEANRQRPHSMSRNTHSVKSNHNNAETGSRKRPYSPHADSKNSDKRRR